MKRCKNFMNEWKQPKSIDLIKRNGLKKTWLEQESTGKET